MNIHFNFLLQQYDVASDDVRDLERDLENAHADVRSLRLTNETLNTALEAKVRGAEENRSLSSLIFPGKFPNSLG